MSGEQTACHQCQAGLPAEARFCMQCGASVDLAGKTATDAGAMARKNALPPRLLPPGSRIGHYTIKAVLGEGGMAAVYRAHDSALDRTVAIKLLHASLLGDAGIRRRFAREARIMTSWHHPHVVSAYDTINEGDVCALVMELVDGPSLHAYLDRWGGPLPLADVRLIFDGVLDAMAHAHDLGIVHRDLKPQNILIYPTQAGLTAKVVDFGIIKILDGTTYTMTGALLGTCRYMSPEQVKSPESVDIRSDIYSLGVTLYHAVTGRCPFESSNQYSLMMAHVQSEPPMPSQFRADLPAGLEGLILDTLAKNPADRPRTCRVFRNRLAEALAGVEIAAGADAPREPVLCDADGSELLLVPGGTFQYGPSRRSVYLDDYYLARHPVTNAQFERFLDATGYWPTDSEAARFLGHWRGRRCPPAIADHPVVFVSWLDANAYCRWAGRRLPSEAEWEKAARGGDGRVYPWGKAMPTADHANFGFSTGGTVPVGSFPSGATPYGHLDMAGNAGEWCEDADAPRFYLHGPERNPRNSIPDGERRVVRGGGWMYDARSLRTFARQSFQPTYRIGAVGFRCAL